MKTSYQNQAKYIALGLVLSLMANRDSGCGIEPLKFGGLAYWGDKDGEYLKHPHANQVVFSADFVTSNVINGNVNVTKLVNGVSTTTTTAISPVTFSSDHDTTVTALIAAIETAVGDDGTAAAGDASGDNRTINVNCADGSIVILSDFVVTAGASQATAAYNFYDDFGIAGIVEEGTPQQTTIGADVDEYPAAYQVSVVTKGDVTTISGDAVTGRTDELFARYLAGGGNNEARGQFAAAAGGVALSVSTYVKPLESAAADTIFESRVSI